MITDVEDVKFVINFDYPSNSEDYVHRIGRTGRSQRTGTAYTFFTPSNSNKAADLVAVLKEAKQVINPKLQEMANNRSWNNSNNSSRGKWKLLSFCPVLSYNDKPIFMSYDFTEEFSLYKKFCLLSNPKM